MPLKTTSKEPTPEAQLKAWVDQFDPKTQKLFRAVRTALRKRFPSANELAYDYGKALVISYAPADKGIDGLLAIRASTAGVALYFNQAKNLSDPKRLLKGTGKQARFILLESASQLDGPDVEALIAATLKHATVLLPATGKGSLIIKSEGAKKVTKKPNKLVDGAKCQVVGGTHAGKAGTVTDIKTSKTGHVTITVVQKDGERFKTLAKNVVVAGKTGN